MYRGTHTVRFRLPVAAWIIGWTLLVLAPTPARTADVCDAASSGIPPDQVILLAQEIEAQPSQTERAFKFASIEETVDVGPNAQIVLAASFDGQGWLSTDDSVQLSSGSGTWEWDFRNESHSQIVPIPPQDVTHLFVPGSNEVKLKLTDLTEPEFSSRAYYLLVYYCPAPTATVSPTVAPTTVPIDTPTSSPSPTAGPIAAPTETVTSVPTATMSSTPTSTPTATEVAMVAPVVSVPENKERPRWSLWAGIGAAALSILLATAFWLFRSKRLVGEIEVYRNDQFMHSVLLAGQSKPILTLGASGDIVLASDEIPDVVAQIYAKQGDGGQIEMCFDRFDTEDGSVVESLLLHDGMEIRLPGGYSVRYINPLTEDQYYEGEEYG